MLVRVLVTTHVWFPGDGGAGDGGAGGGGGAGGVGAGGVGAGGVGGEGVGLLLLLVRPTSFATFPLSGSLTIIKLSMVVGLGNAEHV